MSDARPFHWEFTPEPVPREVFRIEGGRPLTGSVTISGSKNAALKLLAAATLTGSCPMGDDGRLRVIQAGSPGNQTGGPPQRQHRQSPSWRTDSLPRAGRTGSRTHECPGRKAGAFVMQNMFCQLRSEKFKIKQVQITRARGQPT